MQRICTYNELGTLVTHKSLNFINFDFKLFLAYDRIIYNPKLHLFSICFSFLFVDGWQSLHLLSFIYILRFYSTSSMNAWECNWRRCDWWARSGPWSRDFHRQSIASICAIWIIYSYKSILPELMYSRNCKDQVKNCKLLIQRICFEDQSSPAEYNATYSLSSFR